MNKDHHMSSGQNAFFAAEQLFKKDPLRPDKNTFEALPPWLTACCLAGETGEHAAMSALAARSSGCFYTLGVPFVGVLVGKRPTINSRVLSSFGPLIQELTKHQEELPEHGAPTRSGAADVHAAICKQPCPKNKD